MKLLSLHAKNLFSLGEVEVNLEDRGLVLVTGYSKDEGSSNGAGKSSLANKAILWTLFGETAGGIRADNVGNRHARKGTFGEVRFQAVDGKLYTVRRERPARLVLAKDGLEVSAKTARDTQEQINQLLGIDFKTFIQTSFFGQGRGLSYAGLTPKDQKAVLESILPMEEVDAWAQYADTKLKEIKPKADKAKNEFTIHHAKATALDEQLIATKKQAEYWKKSQQEKVHTLSKEILHAKEKCDIDRDRIVSQLKTWDDKGGLPHFEATIKEVNASIEEVRAARAEVLPNLTSAKESLTAWNTRHSYLTNEAKKLDKAISCPTCMRPFDDSTVKAVEVRKADHLNLIEEADLNKLQAAIAVTALEKEYSALDRKESELVRYAQDVTHYKHQYEFTQNQIAQIEASARVKIEELGRRIEEIQNQEFPYDTLTLNLQMEIEKVNALWKQSEDELNTLNTEISHLTYWRDIYAKELKLKLFEQACPFLNGRVAHHLDRLNNNQIKVQFHTVKRLANGNVKEEFNVIAASDTGGEGYDSLSGGEQQMVSFAIGLALADLASRFSAGDSSLLILDEPFTELDARNSEAIVNYLMAEVSEGLSTVLLISNDENLKGLIPNRVHVVKEKGTSYVV
jgi:DNA repair exonuclease SbcCD ATPase subunit